MSFRTKLLCVIAFISLSSVGIYQLVLWWLGVSGWSFVVAVVLAVGTSLLMAGFVYPHLTGRIMALRRGLESLADGDFSVNVRVGDSWVDDLTRVNTMFNKTAAKLRDERQQIHQRELILDSVIQYAGLSLLLLDKEGRIIYANEASRKLLNGGAPVIGTFLHDILSTHSTPFTDVFSDMLRRNGDGIFSVFDEGDKEVYHLSRGEFSLQTKPHTLYLVKQLTREIAVEENRTWKNIIRVMSHELNNSLVPISSMAHSGGLLLAKQRYDQLPNVFDAIVERSNHLKEFIANYTRLSKLPAPVKMDVDWADFIGRLESLVEFKLTGILPSELGFFDVAQLEQVLLNIIKNAHESGCTADDVALSVEQLTDSFKIKVLDRGKGMSQEVMRNALLPLYSTKPEGSGVGLSLSLDIIQNHGGSLSLSNRKSGGVQATISLPLSVRGLSDDQFRT